MSYTIQLSAIGRHLYPQRDIFVERCVQFLAEQMGHREWHARRKEIERRLQNKLTRTRAPIEGISIRDREDEIGWYLYLGEMSIADPPALEVDQASRTLPYLNALGRRLGSISRIQNVQDRLRRLVKLARNTDPDQAIFELLVGAAYVDEGWSVTAEKESSTKTPDYAIQRGNEAFEVECKRLARRPDYSANERDRWLHLWKPAEEAIFQQGLSGVFTIVLHVELNSLPDTYLVQNIPPRAAELLSGHQWVDIGVCTAKAQPVDYSSIASVLKENWVKASSSRERELVTGRHEPHFGLTYKVRGRQGSMGSRGKPGNKYWEELDYVLAAYWKCDAEASLEAKARDVMKRLSDAVAQLRGSAKGVAHIGIETAEGSEVELIRSKRIAASLERFDPRGKQLEWLYLHFFQGEAPPDQIWQFDETCHWRRMSGTSPARPLQRFIVSPPSVDTRDGAHWLSPEIPGTDVITP